METNNGMDGDDLHVKVFLLLPLRLMRFRFEIGTTIINVSSTEHSINHSDEEEIRKFGS